MTRVRGLILVFVLALFAVAGQPALACGSGAHAAIAKAPAARTMAVAVTDRMQADHRGQDPCAGHGCCHLLGVACSIACANAGAILDVVEAPALSRPFTAGVEKISRTVGIVIDPEIDPPRSLPRI